jgi:carboxypeptidase D
VVRPTLTEQLYIAGESYAGQHIPYITRAILDRNKRAAAHSKWNLKGILIGNGWIQGTAQYPAYLRYAYDHGLIARGSQQAQAVEAKMNVCNALITSGGADRVDIPECEAVLSEILFQSSSFDGGNRMCYNMYDVRLKDHHPSCGMEWPPDLEHVTPYLRRKDVVDALHINSANNGWMECNSQVGSAFRALKSAPAFTLLPGILAEIPVVLFSGEQDLICNHLGTEELIHNLEWNGGKGFELGTGSWAPRRAWSFENQPAGFYQSARNLTYILFHNSSHMVPFDHPRRTRDMLDRFMGVDIGPIGGSPVVSVIDGETAPVTSVGGTPNSTLAQQEQGERIKDAEWKAYRKSGEVALVVVALAAAAWGVFVWRARRRAGRGPRSSSSSSARYKGLWTSDPDDDEEEGIGLGLNGGARGAAARRRANGDVEAGDFDETRLRDDDEEDEGPGEEAALVEPRFSVGGDSEAEDKRDGGG